MCTILLCSYTSSISLFKGKSNDKGKLIESERALQRFGLKPGRSADITTLPWILSKNELEQACQRLTYVVIPTHYDFNPQYLFTHPSRLKCHDWKQVQYS